ncbi:MAG: magnesium chelatase subunit [Gammaproteobacteria bacterium]|jgi:magnesium chelatase subunit D|nr:magnesium chelatase subunit [Gammaproteobacteria bacterium]
MRAEYPFSAVVGQDDLKLALLLTAVDPTIGGVLIKGERGTAKTTIARGLATLLPAGAAGETAPFVELPLGATEDRVVGSLDVNKALRDGHTQLRSGVLARANGGVLYVDEVNLLPDHLVDLLLDAAATGWVTVERDGVSAGEAARFVLIGTMNPEEGELRPQFLDRFGLSVHVHGLDTQEQRMAAVNKRLEFDADAAAVIGAARPAEDSLRTAIVEARARLLLLPVTGAHLSMVTAICAEKLLDGIRGDLAIIKTARALAAWERATEIGADHIRRAAAFALPHRIRRRPAGAARKAPPAGNYGPGFAQETGNAQVESSASAPPAINLVTDLIDRESSGRRGGGSIMSRRATRATPYDQTGTLAINETLTTAAVRGRRVGERGIALATSDLMQHARSGPGRSSVLFLVDASASMATQRRLELAKGAALGLLRSNYQHRDEVALMVFRGAGADLVMPFTSGIDGVEQALRDVPTGGRTPLARALIDAAEILRAREPSLLIVLTDGRANVSVADEDPWQESLAAAARLKDACAGAVVIDCELGPIVLGRPRQLAAALGAECISLSLLEAGELTVQIRRRLDSL